MEQQEWNRTVRDKMGRYVKSLGYFAMIFFLIFIVNGIWHAILASQLNKNFFLLVGGKLPRNITISICALSFGSLIIMITLLCSLYMSGTKFILHAIICAITVLTILGNIILTFTNLVLTANKAQQRFKNQIHYYIDNEPSNKIVSEWMTNYNCTDSASCDPSIKKYVSFICNGELIACSVMLFVTISCIIGVTIAVVKMGMLKRPDEEPGENQNLEHA